MISLILSLENNNNLFLFFVFCDIFLKSFILQNFIYHHHPKILVHVFYLVCFFSLPPPPSSNLSEQFEPSGTKSHSDLFKVQFSLFRLCYSWINPLIYHSLVDSNAVICNRKPAQQQLDTSSKACIIYIYIYCFQKPEDSILR